MKLNVIKTAIAVAICALITYALHGLYDGENRPLLLTGSFITLAVTLVLTMGVTFSRERMGVNVKVVAGIFFVALLMSNLIFSLTDFSAPNYIIVNGVITLVFLLIAYSLCQTKQ